MRRTACTAKPVITRILRRTLPGAHRKAAEALITPICEAGAPCHVWTYMRASTTARPARLRPGAARLHRARSIYEAARDKARAIAKTEAYAVTRRQRQEVEMHFAHLKRILRLDRLRLPGPSGAKDEFLLAATAQNLRELAKLNPLPAPYSPHEAAQLNFASPADCRGRK